MAMLGMQSTGLKEEISTLQFMMSHEDGATRVTCLEQMAELLKQQKEMCVSFVNHSSNCPKLEKMDIMSSSTMDVMSSPGDISSSSADQVWSMSVMKQTPQKLVIHWNSPSMKQCFLFIKTKQNFCPLQQNSVLLRCYFCCQNEKQSWHCHLHDPENCPL